MILNKEIEININSRNRVKYEKITGKNLENGDRIFINQNDVLPASRIKIECECDVCKKIFKRERVSIKREKTICSNKCKRLIMLENNPNPKKEDIEVYCNQCGECIYVNEYKYNNQENFFCSRRCYSMYRSENYNGSKIYNYNSVEYKCDNCKKEFIISQFSLKRNNNSFCSHKCYSEFRADNYSDIYYSPIKRDRAKSTIPEKMVKEWLDKFGIRYKEEAGFLRKYYSDFYLKDFNVVLEVYGDYWHVNPDIYDVDDSDNNKKKINEQQKTFIERDYKRELDFISSGIDYRVIWENEVYNDLDFHMNSILKDKIESVTTTRSTPVKGEDIV